MQRMKRMGSIDMRPAVIVVNCLAMLCALILMTVLIYKKVSYSKPLAHAQGNPHQTNQDSASTLPMADSLKSPNYDNPPDPRDVDLAKVKSEWKARRDTCRNQKKKIDHLHGELAKATNACKTLEDGFRSRKQHTETSNAELAKVRSERKVLKDYCISQKAKIENFKQVLDARTARLRWFEHNYAKLCDHYHDVVLPQEDQKVEDIKKFEEYSSAAEEAFYSLQETHELVKADSQNQSNLNDEYKRDITGLQELISNFKRNMIHADGEIDKHLRMQQVLQARIMRLENKRNELADENEKLTGKLCMKRTGARGRRSRSNSGSGQLPEIGEDEVLSKPSTALSRPSTSDGVEDGIERPWRSAVPPQRQKQPSTELGYSHPSFKSRNRSMSGSSYNAYQPGTFGSSFGSRRSGEGSGSEGSSQRPGSEVDLEPFGRAANVEGLGAPGLFEYEGSDEGDSYVLFHYG